MVNPNAAGNKAGAAKGDNPWGELTGLKMGAVAAAGEKIENKKNSLVAKFENYRANKAKARAEAKFKEASNTEKAAKREMNSYQKEVNALSNKMDDLGNSVENKKDTYNTAQDSYSSAKKEAGVGNYAKNQAKQVAELLKAGGSVIKNGINAFIQSNKGIGTKIKAIEVAKAGSIAAAEEARSAKIKEKVDNAIDAKQKAKDKWREILSGFGKNKETYKNNVEAKKNAKAELDAAKKDYDAEVAALDQCTKEYDESNAFYEKANAAYQSASEKRNAAQEKRDAARARAKEAKDRVKAAQEVVELRDKLGRMDINKVKAEISERKAAELAKQESIQKRVDSISKNFYKALGLDPKKDKLSDDAQNILDKILQEAVGKDRKGSSELKAINKQEAIIERYESAKKKQAEKVAKNETVKVCLGSFVNGIVAKFAKIPNFFGDEEEDEEEEAFNRAA